MNFNNLNKFEKDIFTRLFNYYNKKLDPDIINVLVNKGYDKSKRISIYQTPFNSIIFTYKSFFNMLQRKIDTINNKRILLSQLKKMFQDIEFTQENDTHCLFLDPKKHKIIKSIRNFEIREINKYNKEKFIQLKNECSKDDLNEAQVSFDDPYLIGVFKKEKLISAASYWFWGNSLADIGVITHPEYRKMGVGKIIVSNLSKHGIKISRINVYRHDENNIASRKLALSLNFEEKMVIQSCKVIN